jgi:hypothetical protein
MVWIRVVRTQLLDPLVEQSAQISCMIISAQVSSLLLKVRGEVLQSWDSLSLLILFQPLHNKFIGARVVNFLAYYAEAQINGSINVSSISFSDSDGRRTVRRQHQGEGQDGGLLEGRPGIDPIKNFFLKSSLLCWLVDSQYSWTGLIVFLYNALSRSNVCW